MFTPRTSIVRVLSRNVGYNFNNESYLSVLMFNPLIRSVLLLNPNRPILYSSKSQFMPGLAKFMSNSTIFYSSTVHNDVNSLQHSNQGMKSHLGDQDHPSKLQLNEGQKAMKQVCGSLKLELAERKGGIRKKEYRRLDVILVRLLFAGAVLFLIGSWPSFQKLGFPGS